MSRRRWVYVEGEAIEVGADYAPEPKGPLVFGDLPSYQSPIDNHWVDGRVARREDLKRNGCRPWEGRAMEEKEAGRQRAYADQKLDSRMEETARRAFHQLHPNVRREIGG